MFPDPPQHKDYNKDCTDPKKSRNNKHLYNGTTLKTTAPVWEM